jgi:hypothetical protein
MSSFIRSRDRVNSKGVIQRVSLRGVLLLMALLLGPGVVPAFSYRGDPTAVQQADLHEGRAWQPAGHGADAGLDCANGADHQHSLAGHCCQPGCSTPALAGGVDPLAFMLDKTPAITPLTAIALDGVSRRRYRPPKTAMFN